MQGSERRSWSYAVFVILLTQCRVFFSEFGKSSANKHKACKEMIEEVLHSPFSEKERFLWQTEVYVVWDFGPWGRKSRIFKGYKKPSKFGPCRGL